MRTGLFGTKESFVPLAAARFDGAELVVDATKDKVNGAPRVDEDGHLSEQQEAEIYRYYGISAGTASRGTRQTAPVPGTAAGTPPAGRPTRP